MGLGQMPINQRFRLLSTPNQICPRSYGNARKTSLGSRCATHRFCRTSLLSSWGCSESFVHRPQSRITMASRLSTKLRWQWSRSIYRQLRGKHPYTSGSLPWLLPISETSVADPPILRSIRARLTSSIAGLPSFTKSNTVGLFAHSGVLGGFRGTSSGNVKSQTDHSSLPSRFWLW